VEGYGCVGSVGFQYLGASLEGKVSRARCIPPEHTFCTSGARKVQSTSTSLVWRQARRLRGVWRERCRACRWEHWEQLARESAKGRRQRQKKQKNWEKNL